MAAESTIDTIYFYECKHVLCCSHLTDGDNCELHTFHEMWFSVLEAIKMLCVNMHFDNNGIP